MRGFEIKMKTTSKFTLGLELKSRTEYGLKREMDLMNDLCLDCLFLRGITEKYCDKWNTYLIKTVKSCSYYANKRLDEF